MQGRVLRGLMLGSVVTCMSGRCGLVAEEIEHDNGLA